MLLQQIETTVEQFALVLVKLGMKKRSSAPPKNNDATVGLGIVTGGMTVIGSGFCLVTDRRSPESGCLLLDRPRTDL